MYYWVYQFNKKQTLLYSGRVTFQTIGSNSIGWVLNNHNLCEIYEIVLDSNEEEKSHIFYINQALTQRLIYLNYKNYLGTVSPLKYINQTYFYNYTINEVAVSFCDDSLNCVQTPQGSAFIPIGSSLFYINTINLFHKNQG